MRTIRFRGKRLDGEGWVYGSLWGGTNYSFVTPENYGIGVDESTHFLEAYVFEVLPESVGQWTGKFDINSVEIYQGDIVNSGHLKSDEWIPSIAVIEWDEDFAMFRQVLKGVNEGLEQLMDVPCEVIGNIIDSPELMEVE